MRQPATRAIRKSPASSQVLGISPAGCCVVTVVWLLRWSVEARRGVAE